MMGWESFIYFAITAILCSVGASLLSLAGRRKAAVALAVSAAGVLAVFICGLWIELERPVLRTTGETRLWYSFFAIIAGLFTYIRWKYNAYCIYHRKSVLLRL